MPDRVLALRVTDDPSGESYGRRRSDPRLGQRGPPDRARPVAYQSDGLDALTGSGWSVTAVGAAEFVDDPNEVIRYRERLDRWLPGARDRIVRITIEEITGSYYDRTHHP
ncbi:pyridoxamine 5'-phosphate oxidase family protein [Nocardia blacklockiae]|uniref:pyridoxamine 5'-phosphate oxidase family protein n=1 Tax=Nocardia blacklockiae TaxID=480036 RepID=UPI001893D7B6|nr:pyridoxamine 5'-phosphate oxidase family protein [Nocardia blacklockiae]MBF6171025.1 pyridoxamine 5'-phosphate oxidase family protein [Nocardia blacklockiae]